MKREIEIESTEENAQSNKKESSQKKTQRPKEPVQKKSRGDSISDNSDVLWAMTAQQTADLRALHDSIQLGPTTTEPTDDRPEVGSIEWHQRRRESHKLVERKRREAINDGINKIALIVPGCEKNKGSILNRAADYIKQLKEQEVTLLEKVSLEKLLTEQSVKQLRQELGLVQKKVNDLTSQADVMKKELDVVLAENEMLKGRLKCSLD